MTAHIKHVLIAAGILAVCLFAVRAYVDMRVRLAQITTSSAEKIKADEKTTTQAQGTITAAEQSNVAIDADTKRKLDTVQAQLASKPGSDEIRSMINEAVSGLKGLQSTKAADGTALLAIPDTQENRDAINQTDAAFKSCRFNLDDCQQKQANFQNIIDAKDQQIAAKDDTIQTLTGENRRLASFGKGGNFWARTGRVALPVGCAAATAYGASLAKASPRTTTIATVAGGSVCAFSFRF